MPATDKSFPSFLPKLFLLMCFIPLPSATAQGKPGFWNYPCSISGIKDVSLKHSKALDLYNVKPKSLTLIFPGLNLNPHKMNAMEKIFNKLGSDTLTLALRGHRMDVSEKERLENFKNISSYDWQTESLCAFQTARKLAAGKPIIFFGRLDK